MKTSLPVSFSGARLWALGALVMGTGLARAQAVSPAPPSKASLPKSTSTQDQVKAGFSQWRYAGAKITASFARGPLSLLSVSTQDDLQTVWKFYTSRIPTDNKLPLSSSWEIPGDNTMIGANYALGSSYALSLNSSPREAGTIIYQKGGENIVIEMRARTPEQIKNTGLQTDIKLIKMRPLDPAPAKNGAAPVQGAAIPQTAW